MRLCCSITTGLPNDARCVFVRPRVCSRGKRDERGGMAVRCLLGGTVEVKAQPREGPLGAVTKAETPPLHTCTLHMHLCR